MYALLFISVPWTPVNKTEIGRADLNTATTLSYSISSIIPSTAREVLVYPTVLCGNSEPGNSGADIAYYVEVNGVRYENFLYMHGYPQNAYNTNSDNMWFPMPSNRMVYVKVPVPFPQFCYTYVSVIGYR